LYYYTLLIKCKSPRCYQITQAGSAEKGAYLHPKERKKERKCLAGVAALPQSEPNNRTLAILIKDDVIDNEKVLCNQR